MSRASTGYSYVRSLSHQVASAALDLLFPPHCVNCQRMGSLLCPRCLPSITWARDRLVDGLEGVCVAVDFSGAATSAIHAFKYQKQTRLVELLGPWLIQTLDKQGWEIDLVVPVPLHERRQQERGYNQSALLAQFVADRTGWAYSATALQRVRETRSQVTLNAHERRENVWGAFVAKPAAVEGKRVLVVDDVLTTGATLAACAAALRDAGAVCVYGGAVAGAVFGNEGRPDASGASV